MTHLGKSNGIELGSDRSGHDLLLLLLLLLLIVLLKDTLPTLPLA
jgi:hypothetical protein